MQFVLKPCADTPDKASIRAAVVVNFFMPIPYVNARIIVQLLSTWVLNWFKRVRFKNTPTFYG